MNFSFIIVNWNTRQLTLDCIASLEKECAGFSYEIIVVDNASTDDTVPLLRVRYPNCTIIENTENVGFARGNNVGILLSKGKYVCLVNSDTLATKQSLRAVYQYMESNPSIGIIGPKLLNSDGSLQRSFKQFPTLRNTFCKAFFLHRLFPRIRFFSDEEMGYFDGQQICNVEVVAGAFMVIRRDCIERLCQLDERFFFYGEDVDLCWRCLLHGFQVVYYPQASIIHYGGESSKKSGKKLKVQMTKARIQLLKKYYSAPQCFLFRTIMIADMIIRLLLGFPIAVISKFLKKETETPLQHYLKNIIWIALHSWKV